MIRADNQLGSASRRIYVQMVYLIMQFRNKIKILNFEIF